MQTASLAPSLFPKPEPTFERIFVVPPPRSTWQAVDLVRVSSTQDHVIRLECCDETLYDIVDPSIPLLLPEALQTRCSHIVLKRFAFAITQMCKLHRLQDAIDDHR